MQRTNKIKFAPCLLRNQRGSFSIVALWLLGLLSLLSISLVREALLDLRLDGYGMHAAKAAWLARAGVRQAMAVLQSENAGAAPDSVDALSDSWASNPDAFRDVACGEGHFTVFYLEPGLQAEPEIIFGILDENRKININMAPLAVLRRLPGMNDSKAAALKDWIDKDSDVRVGGAESNYYAALQPPYACKNGPLESLEELQLVSGFTAQDVSAWRSLVTVFGDGKVNVNTTTAAVLVCLGLQETTAERIIKFRAGPDGIPYTQDDFVFRSENTITETLIKKLKLPLKAQVTLHRLVSRGLLGVRSSHFRVHAQGAALQGRVRFNISAILFRAEGSAVTLLHWEESAGLHR